ncbi:hypothetical protein IKF67_02200 [Candidatus Saccharibacteria bacterium]|nr:hypothetical protein [Candidatus Saccharibacteria bacterium]
MSNKTGEGFPNTSFSEFDNYRADDNNPEESGKSSSESEKGKYAKLFEEIKVLSEKLNSAEREKELAKSLEKEEALQEEYIYLSETSPEGAQAEEPSPEDNPSGEEPTPDNQEADPNDAEGTAGKAKKCSRIKRFFAGVALAAVFALGIFGARKIVQEGNAAQVEAEDDDDGGEDDDDGGENEDNPETARGIYDGYGERAMYLDSNKGGDYDFANAVEAAEVCNNDEVEMVKYTAGNQVESLADYIANLPEQLQPEGFRGLSILETDQKLESLSPEEYDSVFNYFCGVMDGAFTQEIELEGDYHNAYMRQIDENAGYTHDNMELVSCITHENGTRATEFYWTDDGTANGNIIGSMIVKISHDENGNIDGGCLQVVIPNSDGSRTYIYFDLPDIAPDNPSTPDTPDNPNITPRPKNQTEADENSGASAGIVTPEGQERQVTAEPVADGTHPYNPDTNTYNYIPEEQAGQIGYEVTNDIREIGQESAPITTPGEIVTAEEMVTTQTAPEMVIGTREGVDEANNFDAGATVGTGEVTGDTPSADGSRNTIRENLEQATGNPAANPSNDSQGF